MMPQTGKYLTSAQLESGTITLNSTLNLNAAKPDAETVRVVLHELGHADFAARDTLGFAQLDGKDKNGPQIPHDQRKLEVNAITYENRQCAFLSLCPHR
jgi:hypothetical protein